MVLLDISPARFVLEKHGGGADQWPLGSLRWLLEAVATNRRLGDAPAAASGRAESKCPEGRTAPTLLWCPLQCCTLRPDG